VGLKVFYSWQSDTDSKVNRAFLREAIETAIADLDVQDAERPAVDQDTKGVLGSPVIADTISRKIEAAAVMVADVTLTGSTPEGKRLCNSNVAIELGYALGIHGDQVLLKVMNTHFGPPQDLPFDLAHRRWPVQYDLAPGAPPSDRRRAQYLLTQELRNILRQYLQAAHDRQSTEADAPGAAKRADLRADFLKYGSNKYRLIVVRKGLELAGQIRLSGNPPVLDLRL
jgi:hypothetical protein